MNSSEPDTAGSSSPLGEAAIRGWLIAQVARTADLDERDVDPAAPFDSLGIDSMAAAEMLAELEVELGIELDPTVVFSHGSPSKLAAFLANGAHETTRSEKRDVPASTDGRTGRHRRDDSVRSGAQGHEPIAIVGLGCRFPGASGPDAYWRLLCDGVDAIGSVPAGRWEPRDLPAELPPQVSLGGFVDGIDQFDPVFFGISQLEADRMDPQQRMVLELAWEALEDGNVRPSELRGSPTGVFLGISSPEYGRRQGADPELIDVFFGTGNALSIAANRISYGLDLRGPSIAIDTACSSSLVAIHLACAAIRRGECSTALAGGANAILTPLITLNFNGAGAIAPDGRCKAFDASADGIVRGEGAGLVWLKPLSAAVSDRDRIYCVIEGSAVNSDGRSNGLTAPNPDAQRDVFVAACRDAAVDAGTVDYVEAHGTGTVLGDAMELRSLDLVYGGGRSAQAPLLVGSVKTNIGHLEPAAGIAGVIKTALALHHRSIPASLHFENPNPFLTQTDALSVVTAATPWPEAGAGRAAISGFGFGGTNAHVILGAPPDPHDAPAPAVADEGPIVLAMSARSPAALAAGVDRLRRRVEEDPASTRELAVAQALTRDEHPRRLAIVADNSAAVAEALSAVATGKAHRCAFDGQRRSAEPARVVFVFSGQGRAWWPLDAELLVDPVIGSVLERCDAELAELAGFSIMDVLRSGQPVLDHERAQPLLYSLQVALAERWRAFGVEPDLVLGQSIGEVAAAHIAGALTLADGLEIVLNRGRFMEEANGTGHTAFVELPADDVADLIERLGVEVTIAGITAPDNCLVSGPKADTVAVVDAAVAMGVMAQVFTVGDIPGHGPMMTPYADKLAAAAAFVEPRPTRVPLISTVTGGLVDGAELDPEYWGRNLRQAVRFTDAMASAVEAGAELFVEIAAHPVVEVSARRCLSALGSAGLVQHTIKQGEPGALALRRSLAAAWAAGAAVDWRAVTGRSEATVDAPRYAWDHRSCWYAPPDTEGPGGASRGGRRPSDHGPRWHPLLQERVDADDPAGTQTWRAALGADAGYPTPGLVLELAAAATASAMACAAVALFDIELAPPSVAVEGLHLSAAATPTGRSWQLTGRIGGHSRPVARGRAEPLDDAAPTPIVPTTRLALAGVRLDGVEVSERAATRPSLAAFLGSVRSLVTSPGSAVASLEVPGTGDEAPWAIGPALVDAALGTAALLGAAPEEGDVPVTIERVVLRRRPGSQSRAVIDLANGADRPRGERGGVAPVHIDLVDEWGAAVVELHGVEFAEGATGGETLPGALLVERWAERPLPAPEATPQRRWFCSGGEGDELVDAVRVRLGAETAGMDAWLDDGRGANLAVVVFDGAHDPWDTIARLARRPPSQLRLYVVTRVGRLATDPADRGDAALRNRPELDSDAAVLAGSLGALVATCPQLRPTSIDIAEGVDDLDALIAELFADAPDDAVIIRGSRRSTGRLSEVPVPAPGRVSLSAAGRPWRAIWGEDGAIDIVPLTVAEPGPGQVTIEVTAAVLGTAEHRAAFPGGGVGVAAIGTVVGEAGRSSGDPASPTSDDQVSDELEPGGPVPGDRAPAHAGVAVVGSDSVASRLVVDRTALRTIPDRADGADPSAAAIGALVRLDAWHGDLLAAARRDPGLLDATFARLAAEGDACVEPQPLGGMIGSIPTGPSALDVGGSDAPITETVDAWTADGSATYLVGGDSNDDESLAARRFAIDWLLERGANRVVTASPSGAPPGGADDRAADADHSEFDIADPTALAALVTEVDTVRNPLAGVIWVPRQPVTVDRLDRATAPLSLSLYVTVGSVTDVFLPGVGTPADDPSSVRDAITERGAAAGWAAAAIARHRSAAGTNAHHLAIGPLASPHPDGVDPRLVGRVLDRLVSSDIPAAAYDARGWAHAMGQAGEAAQRPWLAGLAHQVPAPRETAGASLAVTLAATPDHARRDLISGVLAGDIAAILGVDPDDLDADMPVDTYGVDSLVGMELRTRIEATFGYTVPLTELSRSMTTNALADHLLDEAVPTLLIGSASTRSGGTNEAPPLGTPPEGSRAELVAPASAEGGVTAVPVRHGPGPTTWWVPGMFGTPETFTPLGAALDGHDVWAFRAPEPVPITSVTQLAEANVAALRARRPGGPYRIGGYSLGALVAAEMTTQLEAAGDRVEQLWLLDPPPPVDAPDQHRPERVAALLCDHLNELFFGPDATGPPIEVAELPDPGIDADLDAVVVRVRRDGTTALDERRLRQLFTRLWGMAGTSLEAMAEYRPGAVMTAPGTVVLATSGAPHAASAGAWVGRFATPPTVATIDTDHAGLLREPHAAAVAAIVSRSLARPPHHDRPIPAPEATMSQNPAGPSAPRRIADRLAANTRVREAVGAAGNLYSRADFFLRALGGERRFRRLCDAGEGLIVGDRGQIANLSGDPARVRLGHHCLVDGFINVQEYAYLSIGSYCGIGVDARIDCAGYVEIGNGCTLAEGVYIIDGLHHPLLVNERIEHGVDLFEGSHVMDAYGPGTQTSFVRIEDLVWIGLRAVVLSGVTIGRGSVVAAGAVVSQDVPPFSVVAGNPGQVIGQIPADDFDLQSHPTYRAHRGDEPLPDTRRTPREVLDEIAGKVAARPG